MPRKVWDDWGNRRRRRFRAPEYAEDVDPDRYKYLVGTASRSSSPLQRFFDKMSIFVSRWFGIIH